MNGRLYPLDDYDQTPIIWAGSLRRKILKQLKAIANQPGCSHASGISVWRLNNGNVYSTRGPIRKFLKGRKAEWQKSKTPNGIGRQV